jgi:hypothetical protein
MACERRVRMIIEELILIDLGEVILYIFYEAFELKEFLKSYEIIEYYIYYIYMYIKR